MNGHRIDLLAGLIDAFDLKTLAYVGADPDIPALLAERTDKEVEPPGDDLADVIYLDEYSEDPVAFIGTCWDRVKPEGFLAGSRFHHKDVEIMNAVADSFNLMDVQVGPDGGWCVRKP